MAQTPIHVLVIPSNRFVCPDAPHGSVFQQHQAHALARAGFRVGVVAPAPQSLRTLAMPALWGRSQVEREDDHGIPVFRYQGVNWTTGRLMRLYQRQFDRSAVRLVQHYIAEQGCPDIIHAHNCLYAGSFAARRLARYGSPLVITEHCSLYTQRALARWELAHVRCAARQAAARLAVSSNLCSLLEAIVGDPTLRWEYVPNVLDRLFEQQAPPERQRLPGCIFRFLCIANLYKIKNIAGLLQAFAIGPGRQAGFELRIGGDGPERENLRRLVATLRLESSVHLLGRLCREEVFREICDCDVFVLPSHYETFGVVLIEAAACGKPLIATKGSGPDGIVHADNGVLVPPDDPAALAAAMTELAANVHRYDAHAIRKNCLERFGERALVEKLRSIYLRVLSVPADPAQSRWSGGDSPLQSDAK